MGPTVRVFVNEIAVDVAPHTPVLGAVAAHDRALADSVSAGGYLTDGVGRQIEPDSLVVQGLIIRVVVSSVGRNTEE